MSDEKKEQLESKLLELAGKEGFDEGKLLYEEGAVLDILRDSRGIDTRVANDRGRFEKVRIALKKNYFSARCTCRSRGHAICEHAVAAFLQFYEDQPEAVPFPLASPSTATSTGSAANIKAAEMNEAAAVAPVTTANVNGNVIQQVSFQSLLDELDSVIGYLVLHYKGDGFPSGESRWNSSAFIIELHYNDKIYSGSNIKRLVENGSGAAGMVFNHFSPQDQQIMRFFSSHGELSGSEFVLNALDMGALFHCLIGFQRFYANETKINVSKQIAELVFMVGTEEDGIKVQPRLRVEGYGLISTHNVEVISARSGFWLGCKGLYWWIPGVSGPNWLHSFLKGEDAVLSEEAYSNLRKKCSQEILPVSLVTNDDKEDTTIVNGELTPILSIDWQKKSLTARLEFLYDGIRISMDSQAMIWNGQHYISRDEMAEQNVVQELKSMGFNQLLEPTDSFRLQSLERIGEFLDVKLPKLSQSWEIYCSVGFQKKRAVSGDMNLSVNTVEENTNWFELHYNFFTQKGNSAEWKNVVHAVLNGHNYVRLEEGGIAKITNKIKEAIEANIDSSLTGEMQDGNLRFSHFNSVYLGDVLSDYEMENKANWPKLRKSLKEFTHKRKAVKLGEPLDSILRGYQKEGVTWLNSIENAGFHGVLADEMGLGKTLQTLSAVYYSHKKNKKHKPTSLIICPTSLVHNWAAEAKKFIPDFKIGVLYGNSRQKVAANLTDYDLVMTSYALIRRDIDQYKEYEFHYVVLDEAQHIKNATTANARTCKEVKAKHRLILTGTPVENSVRELWSLYDFILPGYLGNRKEFQDRFERKNVEDRQVAMQLLAQRIKPFMLRRKKLDVCEELPPKIEQVVYCDLTDQQRVLYDTIMIEAKNMMEKIKDVGIQKHRFEMLSVLLRLRQLCCHPMLLPSGLHSDLNEIVSAKTELFKELVLESIDSNHRMLVFSQFTGLLGILKDWLEEAGIKYEYLDGSTTNRLERVDRFNSDESIPVFLLSLKAGGTGLNLTGADTVIHYDQWWNPMVEDQATDRSHRIGQTKQVVALKLVTKNTVEEKVIKLQDSKRDLFNQLMSGVPANINELTEDDFQFLLEG